MIRQGYDVAHLSSCVRQCLGLRRRCAIRTEEEWRRVHRNTSSLATIGDRRRNKFCKTIWADCGEKCNSPPAPPHFNVVSQPMKNLFDSRPSEHDIDINIELGGGGGAQVRSHLQFILQNCFLLPSSIRTITNKTTHAHPRGSGFYCHSFLFARQQDGPCRACARSRFLRSVACWEASFKVMRSNFGLRQEAAQFHATPCQHAICTRARLMTTSLVMRM